MKKFFILIGVMAALLFTGCPELSKEAKEKQKIEERQHQQETANIIVNQINYIHDPRVNLCFAYFWHGAMDGGPAFTCVPCESIPPELLTTAEITK